MGRVRKIALVITAVKMFQFQLRKYQHHHCHHHGHAKNRESSNSNSIEMSAKDNPQSSPTKKQEESFETNESIEIRVVKKSKNRSDTKFIYSRDYSSLKLASREKAFTFDEKKLREEAFSSEILL